jgi:hypothetical protein
LQKPVVEFLRIRPEGFMRSLIPLFAAFAILVPAAFADEVTLTNGNTLKGILVTDPAPPKGKLVLEVGSGTVVLDEKDVLSTSKGRSELHEYRERREKIEDSKNPEDYYDLACWAREHKCFRYIRGLCEKVFELDPEHEGAHRLLGHEKIGGKWLTRDEAMRAKGFILYEGRWLTPVEKEMIEAERLRKRELAEARSAERKRKREEEERRRKEEQERRLIEQQQEQHPRGTTYRGYGRGYRYDSYMPYVTYPYYNAYPIYGHPYAMPYPYPVLHGGFLAPSSVITRRVGRYYTPPPIIRWGFPLR